MNYHCSQAKKKYGNESLKRASWYLHQIKKSYINTVRTKSLSKDFGESILRTVSPYLSLQHVKVSISLACLF